MSLGKALAAGKEQMVIVQAIHASLSSVKAAMGSRELWEECCVPMQHYLQTQQPAGLGLGFSFADP